jgi:secreted PhoX family phosphatase
MGVTRRVFLRETVTVSGAVALPFLFARKARAFSVGSLVPDPEGRLDLPEGFSYTVVDQGGQTMSDGYRVPGNPDGMACFSGTDGTLVLLRNHELTTSSRGAYPLPPLGTAPPEAYDATAAGGVTRVVLDGTSLVRVSSNLVLAGTAQNCAGGPSPWGFLSCEEAFDAVHGYTFICPVDAASLQMPRRVPGYGHFRHEAVCIDPSSNVAYLTEDRPDSALYRFVPNDPASPFVGTLQALRVVGRAGFDTSMGFSVGEELEVDWVPLSDPDPTSDTLRTTARSAGAAVVARGEGIWFDRGVVYFTSTNGGPIGRGQVFALRPTATGGTLTLIAQSEDSDLLDGPDNVSMAPWGDLFICEDGFDGTANFIRVLMPNGTLFDFARTTLSELAGVCFSPDGRALFVNIWGADVTLVVTGPFPTKDPDGGGGQGGEGGNSGGAPSAGQAGESFGGASDRGGTSGRGGTSSAGAAGANDTSGAGGAAGATDGEGGSPTTGGTSGGGIDVGPVRRPRASNGDPGCGCSVPGRR